MKKEIFCLLGLNFIMAIYSFALTLSDTKAIELGKQWYPNELRQDCQRIHFPVSVDNPNFGLFLHSRDNSGDYHFPLIFKIPDDPNDYVLLAWNDCLGTIWWRLLKTVDGGQTFQLVCDNNKPIGIVAEWSSFRLVELTGDNIPELVWEGSGIGANGKGQGLAAWQWRNGCFVPITPYETDNLTNSDSNYNNGLVTNSYIEIDDLEGDGTAEVIVGPGMLMHWDEDENSGEDDVTWTTDSPTVVWRYDGIKYVKWYELDPNEPYAIYVPSLGAFHPSTIPFSELSNPGNGKISIFISDPAGNSTADDFAQNSFECNGVSLTFKKIWKNNKQPEENSANFEFVGVPVKQFVRKSQGEWQTNPSDPFILSPDQKMEYHFCGKYVELETNKALIFPQLKEKSEKFFSENPNKTEYFATIPIRAKFKNNKISQTSALICIKKTGNVAEKEKSQNTDSSKTTNPKQTEKK
ncbi:MAG: hypothetical protein GYA35_06480 [Thermoanaerobaculaceae bacterium]|nr:hypothetical protein [Thermoanaerobaculaceae bacterium]